MAKYWIYINGKVLGPFEVEQMIRVPGFSRQSMVSVDDSSGHNNGKWISPAEIPELARIFQKVDELHDAPPVPRAAPKPVKPKMPVRLTPVAPPVEETKKSPLLWILLLFAAAAAAGGLFYWNQTTQIRLHAEERQLAQSLIETTPLPSSSRYSTLRQYLQTEQITSRWEFERNPSGLYSVTVSWEPAESAAGRVLVYTFEANLQVKSVRGLNSAAQRLLAEGFPRPQAPKPAEPPKAKRSPGDFFPSAINDRRQAYEQGDFEAVFQSFSKRRKEQMAQGGITSAGFIRMQKLTYKAGSGLQQTIVKTKNESDTERLVLIRQTQPRQQEIFVKQRWVWENEAWRLDDEEKKTATAMNSAAPEAAAPPEKPKMPNLPGLSDSQK